MCVLHLEEKEWFILWYNFSFPDIIGDKKILKRVSSNLLCFNYIVYHICDSHRLQCKTYSLYMEHQGCKIYYQ